MAEYRMDHPDEFLGYAIHFWSGPLGRMALHWMLASELLCSFETGRDPGLARWIFRQGKYLRLAFDRQT